MNNDGHSVLDWCGQSIWGRGQDRASLDEFGAWVFPSIPDSCEREQLPVIDLKTVGLAWLSPSAPTHKTRPQESGTCEISTHRAAVSDLVLIIRAATDGSFAHDGMSPQRISDSSRTGSFGFWRTTGIGWGGATLYRGFQSSSPETASKYSSTTCFRRDNRCRPHIGRLSPSETEGP